MKIGLQSRFCEHCQKQVMDFTAMDRKQILEYLLTNYNNQVCGRIKASQLDFSDNDFLITIEALNKQSKNTNLSFYLLSLGSLILASCGDEASSSKNVASTHQTVGQKSENNVTENSQSISKGETENKGHQKNKLEYTIPVVVDSFIVPKEELEMGLIACTPSIDSNAVVIVLGNDVQEKNKEPYYLVEKMPEFIGGLDSLSSFVKKNLVYPEWERKNKIQGKVYVRFTIDKTGKVKDATIKRTVSDAKNFDKEVLRIIEKMPNWIPGEQANQKVDVYFTIPIEFKLL